MQKCAKCGHTWYPRGETMKCPKCKTKYWRDATTTATPDKPILNCPKCSYAWMQRGISPPARCPSCRVLLRNLPSTPTGGKPPIDQPGLTWVDGKPVCLWRGVTWAQTPDGEWKPSSAWKNTTWAQTGTGEWIPVHKDPNEVFVLEEGIGWYLMRRKDAPEEVEPVLTDEEYQKFMKEGN